MTWIVKCGRCDESTEVDEDEEVWTCSECGDVLGQRFVAEGVTEEDINTIYGEKN